jgi:transcriptional regulator with XRE-family HTH domain
MKFNKTDPFHGMPCTEGLQLQAAFEKLEPNITDDWMAEAVEACFKSQRDFAKYIGVGPSTVTNWIKERSFPESAKRLVVYSLLWALAKRKTKKEKEELQKERDSFKRCMVVESNGTFSIVGSVMNEDSVSTVRRNIIAEHIPEFQEALHMAGSYDAWAFIETLRNSVLGGELQERIREICKDRCLEEEDIEIIEKEIRKTTFPHLATYNSLKERWTDPETLKNLQDAMSSFFEDVDLNDAFKGLQNNSMEE